MNVVTELTAKDDRYACAVAAKIIAESRQTAKWYRHLDDFVSLLDHPKSLVRNRAMFILAANVCWDEENRFDDIISGFLAHITDESPITVRQCLKALVQIGQTKPQYIQTILEALQKADLSKYKDSMRPLIEKDISKTAALLREVPQPD